LTPVEAADGKFKKKLKKAKEAALGPKAEAPKLDEEFDLDALLVARDPATMQASLKDAMRERVQAQWQPLVMEASERAYKRNKGNLYPNPAIQAYVNRLGQSLIPEKASSSIYVTFRVVESPLPYAEAMATGSVYLSTGLISLMENESQLAFLLMHEAGHVLLSHHLYQIIEAEKAEKRAQRMAIIGAAAGAIVGGALGGDRQSLAQGMGLGAVGGASFAHLQNLRFSKAIQYESDQFATEVLLAQGFDAREALVMMARVGHIIKHSNAAVDLAFGYTEDLPDRSIKVRRLLQSSFKPTVDRILNGEGFQVASPRFTQLMAELKRDNGLAALKRDLFALARANLEEAYAVRSDDPLTLYGLGILFRTVGRTTEELSRAASYLRTYVQFDEGRFRYPDAYLQYAVELMSREDPQLYPEIQKALKTYFDLYVRTARDSLPAERHFIYDSLDMTGDSSWAPLADQTCSPEAIASRSANESIRDGAGHP